MKKLRYINKDLEIVEDIFLIFIIISFVFLISSNHPFYIISSILLGIIYIILEEINSRNFIKEFLEKKE